MDDFFEQMLSPWVEGAALASVNGMTVDSVGAMQALSKMSSSHLGGVIENPGSLHDGSEGGITGENLQFASTKSTSSPQTGQTHQASLQPSSGTSQAMLAVGGPESASLAFRFNMFDSSGISQGSPNLQSPPPLMAPTWRAPFPAAMSPVPAALGQGKSEVFSPLKDGMPGELHAGKRPRDDEDMVGGNMVHAAQPQGIHPGHGDGDQFPFEQGPSGTIRPRVRARRGQATDPHSIAERNRRERIAERMKALQELVPDSNKTDKASMLDEIISYVKFLQMQVKCLSMCRLGGAGAATPLLADLPAEGAASFIAANLVQANGAPGPSQDGIAFAERQVARLMDEDMSAAMQYLQSKGLCLMPISLATAISSTGARQPTPAKGPDISGAEKRALDMTAVAVSGSTSAPPNDLTSATDGLNEAGSSMPPLRDETAACALPPGLSSSSKKGLKSREELQR